MAEKILKTRLQLLKNTDSYFTENNPLTLDGELYIVEVSGGTRFKIGDGVHHYDELNFYEDNLLPSLGFDVDNATDGQIIMYNGTSGKWESVDLTDDNSIVYLDSEGLTLKGYDNASQGQMLVKDNNSGLTWVNPVSDASLQQAVADATAAKNQASNYASQAGTSASDASKSAQDAETINSETIRLLQEKFWWGTIDEYNALPEVLEGTVYLVRL